MQLNIIGIDEMRKIATFLNDNNLIRSGIEIRIPVPDKETMNYINDSFYYDKHGTNAPIPPENDEVNIVSGNLKFQYFLKI